MYILLVKENLETVLPEIKHCVPGSLRPILIGMIGNLGDWRLESNGEMGGIKINTIKRHRPVAIIMSLFGIVKRVKQW
jgi:hypothetical protein